MSGLRDLNISQGRVLPARWLRARYSRASGPGGQHVNKVATKVDLRLDLTSSIEILGAANVERIRTRLKSRLDGDGNLRVVSSRYRDQGRNLEAAISRLETLIRASLARPKNRRPTKPTRSSKERRLAGKQRRSQIKKERTRVNEE